MSLSNAGDFASALQHGANIPVKLANDAPVLSSGQAVKDLEHVTRAFQTRAVELAHDLVTAGLTRATRPIRCIIERTFHEDWKMIYS